jgi:flagellar basal-body rod protein FlgC
MANGDTSRYKTKDIDFLFGFMRLAQDALNVIEAQGLVGQKQWQQCEYGSRVAAICSPKTPCDPTVRISLFSVLSVSASGRAAESTRTELLVENIANAETTRTPVRGPCRRKRDLPQRATELGLRAAFFQTEIEAGVNGVEGSDANEETRKPDERYLPVLSDADKDGYVAFPRINPAEDMMDLPRAERRTRATSP